MPALVWLPAMAQGRPDTTRMSCGQARAIVERAGGIVLSTGGHTFDRFVNNRAFCTMTEITKPAFVPTANNPQCFIGYTCEEFERDLPDRD
ncbi:MAG: hypothetical protein AB7F96_19735 [Beijerinckiaceae bacterium]